MKSTMDDLIFGVAKAQSDAYSTAYQTGYHEGYMAGMAKCKELIDKTFGENSEKLKEQL